jgi:PD-(D/E)XK nuclease superfamily protein
MSQAALYINSKGYAVTRHSYSGSESFGFCPRKYYLERVQGWSDKVDRAARHFGMAVEAGVTFWHQRGQDTAGAVAEFVRIWAEHKDKPYTYSKVEKDWETLNLNGQELIRLYTVLCPTRPYVVKNPRDVFQVQTNFEVFPDTKLAGIEFTSYIDLVAELKGSGDPLIVDMKTSGTGIPDLVVLDPQLRSYSWVKGWPNVAFEWFRKMGRRETRSLFWSPTPVLRSALRPS